jgi:antitoxin ParD1/3/4
MAVDKISIALPRDLVTDIKDAVETGEYATASEVVRDALRDWRAKRNAPALSLADLRKAVLPALASLDRGEGIPAEDVFARLRKKYAAQKAQKKTKRKS